jgi:hypothetical protein
MGNETSRQKGGEAIPNNAGPPNAGQSVTANTPLPAAARLPAPIKDPLYRSK